SIAMAKTNDRTGLIGVLRLRAAPPYPPPHAGRIRRGSMLRNGDAPWQFANLDRIDDLERSNIYDRHVVRYAIGGQKIFLIRREGHMPDALAYQQEFLDLVGGGIDHGNAIGRTECDESRLAVVRNGDSHRLNGFLAHARDHETDLVLHNTLD